MTPAQDGSGFAALLDPQITPQSPTPGVTTALLPGRAQISPDQAGAAQPITVAADAGQTQPTADITAADGTVDAPLLLKLGKAGVGLPAQPRGATPTAAGKSCENIRKSTRPEQASVPDPASPPVTAQVVAPPPPAQPSAQALPDPAVTAGIQATHSAANATGSEKASPNEDPDGGQAPDQAAASPFLPNGANALPVTMQPNLKAAAAAAAPPGSDTGKISDVSRASADSLVSPQMAGAPPAPGSAATDASASATAPGQSGASQSAIAAAGRAVALRLNRAIRNGEETLTVELHPAELGHVAVKLAFHASGVDVQMVLDRQETFQAFTQDRGSLEQQFAQAGIDLGNGGLDLRFGQGGQSGSERGSGMSSSPAATVAAPAESQSILLDGLVNIVA